MTVIVTVSETEYSLLVVTMVTVRLYLPAVNGPRGIGREYYVGRERGREREREGEREGERGREREGE